MTPPPSAAVPANTGRISNRHAPRKLCHGPLLRIPSRASSFRSRATPQLTLARRSARLPARFRWINAALDARHPSEPLYRFLADAEELLRAVADDTGAALERDSADALHRVPLACRDALRLRDDAHLASVLQSLS